MGVVGSLVDGRVCIDEVDVDERIRGYSRWL
jgi:hypothetical protein